ncbi:MAG: hypothetical protein R3Y22_03855 [Bacteroidales bacterium]
MMKPKIIIILVVLVAIILTILSVRGCGATEHYEPIPKPRGYMRIDLPIANYATVNNLPVSFEVNDLANVDRVKKGEWLDIVYPQFNATIHCSYVKVDEESFYYHLDNRIERVMMNTNFQKPTMVDMISESDSEVKSTLFINQSGVITPVEFIATDSVSFILSGTLAMYGDKVEHDSIAPIINYIEGDITQLLKTIKCHF